MSPRQAAIIPVRPGLEDFALSVQERIHNAGFDVEVDLSSKTLNKKIREAQLAQYNFILVVGDKEAADDSVNIRTRDNQVHGTKPVEETIAMFKQLADSYQ